MVEDAGAQRSISFDRIAGDYDATRGGAERGDHFAEGLRATLDPAEPVLEIGVGTGLVAAGLRRLGHQVVGADISLPMLHGAKRRAVPVVAGDARRLPFGPGAFAQAYCVWVLHVVGDVDGVLREVARVLRPGGRFVVVPAVGARPTYALGRLVWDMSRALDPAGRRRDDEERLREIAPAVGLAVRGTQAWPTSYEESPAEVLRKLESRSYSSLWDVDQERWDMIVVPTIEAVRALPNQDAPLSRGDADDIQAIVLERLA